MSDDEFDMALRVAADGCDFGMNGFGGQGSADVLNKLPDNIKSLYRRWNIPTSLLANRNAGHAVRDYARACGIDVAGDLAKIGKEAS